VGPQYQKQSTSIWFYRQDVFSGATTFSIMTLSKAKHNIMKKFNKAASMGKIAIREQRTQRY
jgi:hypothetical protein